MDNCNITDCPRNYAGTCEFSRLTVEDENYREPSKCTHHQFGNKAKKAGDK